MEEPRNTLDSKTQSFKCIFNTPLWRQRPAAKRQILPKTYNSTKMVPLNLPTRPTLLLIVIMSIILVTSAFPQPHLQPLSRNSPPADQDNSKQEQWELYPSISLRDWSIQMLSSPDFGGAKPRTEQLGVDEWTPLSQSQVEDNLVKAWPVDWSQRVGKRNIVVADDAAFREKSKLLTAMERQKWLNSYMQKLLVVN